ncbi:MAG: serine hydrolase [Bacteroidetes bacterium]|nr:serine hydrolase [Bacteroidota bacterium]
MRKIFTLLLISTALFSFAQKQKFSEDKRFAGLDTAFARVLKNWHAAGFAVAVVEKDKVVYAKGFGYRDYENKIPVTPTTLFAIGSCTKAFTASVIGMLVKDGKLDYDKPVRNYLPELKFYNDEMNNKITLRDMMCHRTGLPRHDYSWYFFTTNSRDSLLQRIQYMEPSAGIRERWQYNNFMFFAQGVVAEKITGKKWEDNVREKIFVPLGMSNSFFSVDDMAKNADASIGYGLKNDSIIKKLDYYHIDAMGPAGSINSSVNDMSKWVITWINDGKFEGKQIIPETHRNEAISSQMIVGGSTPDKENPDIYFSNYGFGWMLSSYRGHYRVEHGGNIDGFSASTCFFPSDSVGIIVLSNQNSSSVPSIIRNLIADRMLKLKYKDWNSELRARIEKAKKEDSNAKKSQVIIEKKISTAAHPLKDLEGLYTNNGYGTFDIQVQRDSLFAFAGKKTIWLRHKQYDIFDVFEKDAKEGIDTSENSSPMQFQMNTNGDITSLDIVLDASVKPISFVKSPRAKEISKDSLLKFVGDYDLKGMTLKVIIKDEKKLTLIVPGQPEYELVPVDKNKFNIKTLTGFTIQFNVDDKNEVTELLSIQPNGTFKATRKK